MNQNLKKHRVSISYCLDNATHSTWSGSTVPTTKHVTLLVDDDDLSSPAELLAKHLNVDKSRLTHVSAADAERTLGWALRYVRVSAKRSFSLVSGDLVEQKIQYSRKPFDMLHSEYQISYSFRPSTTSDHWVRTDTDTSIYRFEQLKDRLRVVDEREGRVELQGYIHVPEGTSVKAAVEAALEAGFEEYAQALESRVRAIRDNNTVWSNIKA